MYLLGSEERAAFIEKAINFLIIVCAISALLGILQFFGLNYEHGIRWEIPKRLPDKTDIYSTFGNPNFMSTFLTAVFPLALINLWHNFNNIRKRHRYGLATTIILLCILISRTKAAWGGAIISIILLFIFVANMRNRGKTSRGERPFAPTLSFKKYFKVSMIILLAVIAIVTGISLILPIESNPILAELSTLKPSHLTFKGRELMWQSTFNMIKEHPIIGIGINTFRLNYQNYQGEFLSRHPEYISFLGSAESPHNQYLETAAEQGIIGLLLFLWINIIFFRKGINILRSKYQLKEKMLAIGIMSGTAAILIHAFFEFPLNLVPNAMLYWMYLGFVMAIQIKQEDRRQNSEVRMSPIPVWLSYFIIIVSIVGSLIFIGMSLRPVIASKIHKDTWYLMRDEKWKEAIKSAKRGGSMDPLNDELHLFLGVANYHLTNYSESLKEYTKAYELYPDYMIPYNIGLIHKKMGNLTLAEEYFKKTIFLRPNLPEAYTQLSQVYKEMGKINESIEVLNKGAKYYKF
ncbi:MAG: O-antigen ligase family protein [Nitrospirae bacterium]|nr:O-antigen ligase family protein [Nitrospirota bacterium]